MTNKIKSVTYGIGGHNKDLPNNNIIEIIYYTNEELAQLEAKNAQAVAKAALLERLGITEEEARLLLGGN